MYGKNTGSASVNFITSIKLNFEKDFIMAIKSNRKVTLSLEDKRQGWIKRIDSLTDEPDTTQSVYFSVLDFPGLKTKQVFKNKDVSRGYFVFSLQ